ncbi:uncharacterized protein LOC110446515 isoform X2 [Mizuhopecten yessoensis]|uniref:uncharacterized protein LOC110446515 isoform X2 n=1 Tax=Mizuhopecten yessoensis TaxID=6573 RepID=UPI000B458163|nr:uncharacterized protein LOC110446515 isoform X2 [Mizuhopecten yessoensis]
METHQIHEMMEGVIPTTEDGIRRKTYIYRAMILVIVVVSFLMLSNEGQGESSSLKISQNPPLRPERQIDTSFQFAWVTQTGVHVTKPANQSSIEVAATAAVYTYAFNQGSRLVYLLVRYMRNDTFIRVANTITVGIFNSDEFPSDFPEYSPVELECKWRRMVVTAGNLLCGQDGQFDPEFGEMNLLVQDFAEALVKFVLPLDVVNNIIAAYNSSRTTWDLHPSNYITYFRQGTATWFAATSKSAYETGGMNICSNARPCITEIDLRRNIKTRDVPLFDILNTVYNFERWNMTGNISICAW